MARKLRVQYPGAIYHVMNRGDRREAIFSDDQDRQLFLDTLAEACEKTDWQIHAWCLMGNHFHLVNETPRANPHYLQEAARRPAWVRVDRLFGEWGIPKDSPAGREQFALQMEARRRAELKGDYEPGGWCLGSEQFRQELLAQVSELASPRHAGEEIRESAFAKAERVAQEELTALGWTAQDLQGRRKGDAHKVRIAARLRRETTMTLDWIAARLSMGAATHVAALVQRYNRKDQNRKNFVLTPLRCGRIAIR
jgi:REP element-mobilizing transposase RayT